MLFPSGEQLHAQSVRDYCSKANDARVKQIKATQRLRTMGEPDTTSQKIVIWVALIVLGIPFVVGLITVAVTFVVVVMPQYPFMTGITAGAIIVGVLCGQLDKHKD
jgi:hypothetical protein